MSQILTWHIILFTRSLAKISWGREKGEELRRDISSTHPDPVVIRNRDYIARAYASVRKAHRITGCRSIRLATAMAGNLKYSHQAELWPISLGYIIRQINFRCPSSLFSVATWQPFRHPDLWPRFDASSFYSFGPPVLPTEKGRNTPSAVPMENT